MWSLTECDYSFLRWLKVETCGRSVRARERSVGCGRTVVAGCWWWWACCVRDSRLCIANFQCDGKWMDITWYDAKQFAGFGICNGYLFDHLIDAAIREYVGLQPILTIREQKRDGFSLDIQCAVCGSRLHSSNWQFLPFSMWSKWPGGDRIQPNAYRDDRHIDSNRSLSTHKSKNRIFRAGDGKCM